MPFGKYRDFKDCVAKNRDKRDPEAYCGKIQHQAEAAAQRTEQAKTRHLDGDWVRAKPYGWDDTITPGNVILGGAETRANISGMLTVVRSELTGVLRYAVDGVTVDPATIVQVDPPAH